VFAFSAYDVETEAEICRWQSTLARLPPRHRALLPAAPAKLAAARAAARTNRHFINAMLAAFDEDNEEAAAPRHLTGARAEAERIAAQSGGRCPPGDVEKVGCWLPFSDRMQPSPRPSTAAAAALSTPKRRRAV
jgi:hypothetical protein